MSEEHLYMGIARLGFDAEVALSRQRVLITQSKVVTQSTLLAGTTVSLLRNS